MIMEYWNRTAFMGLNISLLPGADEQERPDCTRFNFIVWTLIGGSLCVFGFFGNILSFIAFQKDRRTPATILLQGLAVSDFTLLAAVFFTDSIPYGCSYTELCTNFWYSWPYIRYIWILTPISHMCSIWFVVLVAFNRYWAVCRPHTTVGVWNEWRTKMYIGIVVFIVFAFNLPRFFEYEIRWITRENETFLGEARTRFGSIYAYQVVYKSILVNVLLILLPIVLLIVLTVQIVFKINQQSAIKRSHVTSKKKKLSRDITFILTSVLVVATICQTPLSVFHFIRHVNNSGCGHPVHVLDNISKLMVNINSMFNFIIYCLFSNKFRTILWNTFTCGHGAKKQGELTLNASKVRDSPNGETTFPAYKAGDAIVEGNGNVHGTAMTRMPEE